MDFLYSARSNSSWLLLFSFFLYVAISSTNIALDAILLRFYAVSHRLCVLEHSSMESLCAKNQLHRIASTDTWWTTFDSNLSLRRLPRNHSLTTASAGD